MNEKEQENKPKLIQMLMELAELQAVNMKLQAAIFLREARNQVDEKVSNAVQSMQESAKAYGRKAEKLAQEYAEGKQGKEDVISRYEECLEDINEEYADELKQIFEEQQELQEYDMDLANKEYELKQDKKAVAKSPEYKEFRTKIENLKKEAKQALNSGRFEVAEQKSAELRELEENNPLTKINSQIESAREERRVIRDQLKECKMQIEECKNQRFEAIEEATRDKNTELENLNKTTGVRRVLGAILNRLNGANRFKNMVIDAMEGKVNEISTEVLPKVRAAVEKGTEESKKRAQNVREGITEMAEAGISTIGSVKNRAVEKGKATFQNIAQRGRDAKNSIITRMQKKLETKRERTAELQAEYDGQEKETSEDDQR